MRNSSLFKSAAPSLLLLLGSCMLEEPDGTNPERSFAPRILEAPQCNQIRMEVAQFSLDGWSGTPPNGSFMRTTTVPYSAGRIKMDGLPSDRTLYFRVSGLDIQGSAIWTIPGGVPTEGGSPSVSIGYGTPYFPRTIAMPDIRWTTDQLFPQIECWTSSWPAWTTDGSLPGPQNTSTSSSKNFLTTSVQLSPGQKLTARCTDGTLWSYASTYDAPSAIAPPAPTGPTNDFYLTPDIYAPTTNSGDIGFTANTSSFSAYSNWKVAYQFNNTYSGGWTLLDLPATVPYSGSGTINAYLMAWSQSQSRWVSGPLNSSTYPAEPTFTGIVSAGGPLQPLSITLPASYPGSAFFSYSDTLMYSQYSHWKIVVQYGAATPTYYALHNHTEYLSGSGTLTAYLMAWNGSNWVSGPANMVTYPTGATQPNPTGPGTDLPKIAIDAPTLQSGTATFRCLGSQSSSYERWTIAYMLNNSGGWSTIDQSSTGVYVSGSGTIRAYLMAWDPTNSRWIAGPDTSTSYPAKPAIPKSLPAAGTYFSAPGINPPAALPGQLTLSNPNTISSYSNWRIV